jgi:hypothetical protein
MIRGVSARQVLAGVRGWPTAAQLFLAAAALRVTSFLIFYSVSLATGHNGQVDFTDPVWYDAWAWYIGYNLRHGALVDIRPINLAGTYDVGFQYWVGLQYAIVGHYPEVARLTSALLMACTAPAVYLAARTTLLGEAIAKRAGWLTALWPSSLYWAGYDLIKDPVVSFLLAIFIVAICASTARRLVLLGTAATTALLLVRSYVGTGLMLVLPLAAVLRRAWATLLAIVVALAAVQALLIAGGQPPAWEIGPYTGIGIPYGSLAGGASRHGSLSGVLRGELGAGAVKVEGGNDATSIFKLSPKAAAGRLAVGLAITLFGPRPTWNDIMHPTVDVGMYPGVIVWLVLMPFAALGVVRAFRSRDPIMLCLTILALGLWVGLSYVYAGVFRQREMAFLPTMILMAWGLQKPWPRHWNLIYGGFLALCFVALVGREIYTHLA